MKISSKYYSLMAISAILLLGTLANAPDAFAAKPSSIEVLYTGPGGIINVQKDAGKQNNLVPCDVPGPGPLCDTTVTVADGDTFEVLGITKDGAIKTELESETCFFIDGTEIIFTNKEGSACLHTSCSQPLTAGVTSGQFPPDDPATHEILVIAINGDDLGDACIPEVVGGAGFVIDKTALLVSGAQMNAAWMIPVIVSGIGFAIVIARKF